MFSLTNRGAISENSPLTVDNGVLSGEAIQAIAEIEGRHPIYAVEIKQNDLQEVRATFRR